VRHDPSRSLRLLCIYIQIKRSPLKVSATSRIRSSYMCQIPYDLPKLLLP